jgi:hypothetical protein
LDSTEIWKDVVGFEGFYQVSNLGRVKSLKRPYHTSKFNHDKRMTKEIILKPKINPDGYFISTLHKEGKRHEIALHRIVAKTFLIELENKKEVNHKDGNKLNNCVDNLEWCDRGENVRHSFRVGLNKPHIGEKHGMAKLFIDLRTGIFYGCMEDAARSRNMTRHQLKNRLTGKMVNNTDITYA